MEYKYTLKYKQKFILSKILTSVTRRGKVNNVPFYTYIFWSYLGLEKSRKWIKTICITSVYWWQHLFLLTASWLVEIICGYQVIVFQRSVIIFSYKASQTLQWIFLGGFLFLGLFLVETHALCFIGNCRFVHIYWRNL